MRCDSSRLRQRLEAPGRRRRGGSGQQAHGACPIRHRSRPAARTRHRPDRCRPAWPAGFAWASSGNRLSKYHCTGRRLPASASGSACRGKAGARGVERWSALSQDGAAGEAPGAVGLVEQADLARVDEDGQLAVRTMPPCRCLAGPRSRVPTLAASRRIQDCFGFRGVVGDEFDATLRGPAMQLVELHALRRGVAELGQGVADIRGCPPHRPGAGRVPCAPRGLSGPRLLRRVHGTLAVMNLFDHEE